MGIIARILGRVLREAAPYVDKLRGKIGDQKGCQPPLSRSAFISSIPTGSVLEIGPFNSPITSGPDVEYFDILDSAKLRDRAVGIGRDPSRIPHIDHVSEHGDLSVVQKQFVSVVSCHAIEHQPDLIAHLKQVERLLLPGGRYFVIAPDRRFSFDNTVRPSKFDDVVAARGRIVHTPESILAHQLETTHNDAGLHWIGLHGRPSIDPKRTEQAHQNAERAIAGEYIDVHAWILAPSEFRMIVDELWARDLIGLRPVAVYETPLGSPEYCAVLERPVAVH